MASPVVEWIARSVGIPADRPGILVASASVSREILDADSTFVAVGDGAGHYPMSITDGIIDERFGTIDVRAGAGLGGQVLLQRRARSVSDYAHDPTISRDFVHVVCDLEGLQGMACVPIIGPDGIDALLYAGSRVTPLAGDDTLQALELVATHAELALQQIATREKEVELARLRERQRLATELHDSVAQMLFAIGVSAHYSRRTGDPVALVAAMEEIEATAARARSDLRAALLGLGETTDGLAFEARLAGEVRLLEKMSGCRVRITGRGDRRDLPQPVEDLLVDTAVEGLRNGVKHAHATMALVHLSYLPGAVTLVVQTEGGPPIRPLGEDPEAGAAPGYPGSAGTGLALLRRRAAQLRGSLELSADPAGHKVLRVEVPLRPPPLGPP